MPREYVKRYESMAAKNREASRRRRTRETGRPSVDNSSWRKAKQARLEAERAAEENAARTQEALHASMAAVELYRLEREAGKQRTARRIEEAKAAYARLLADLAQKAKGGRPRQERANVRE